MSGVEDGLGLTLALHEEENDDQYHDDDAHEAADVGLSADAVMVGTAPVWPVFGISPTQEQQSQKNDTDSVSHLPSPPPWI